MHTLSYIVSNLMTDRRTENQAMLRERIEKGGDVPFTKETKHITHGWPAPKAVYYGGMCRERSTLPHSKKNVAGHSASTPCSQSTKAV
jgi:hypothetical protein